MRNLANCRGMKLLTYKKRFFISYLSVPEFILAHFTFIFKSHMERNYVGRCTQMFLLLLLQVENSCSI